MKRLVSNIYRFEMMITLFFLIICNATWNIATSQDFPLSNFLYIVIDFIIFFVFYNAYKKKLNIIQIISHKGTRYVYLIVCICFIIATYICFGSFFECAWDPRTIMDTARIEVLREYDKLAGANEYYFSQYPNNLLLLWIVSKLLKLFMLLGFGEYSIFGLVIFLLLLNSFAMILVYKIVFSITKNEFFSLISFLYAVFFCFFSPWHIVVYSDSMSLVLPLLFIRVYQQITMNNSLNKYVLFVILSFGCCVAYKLKPQALLVALSVFLYIVIDEYKKKCDWKAHLALYFALLIISITVFFTVFQKIVVPSLHMNLNDDLRFSFKHYIMMGLNDSTDGSFSGDDYLMSSAFDNVKDRETNNINVICDRIDDYGFWGVIRHLIRKQMLNFGDGSFAWSKEGGFIKDVPQWANNKSSNYIRPFLYEGTLENKLFISLKQCLWLFVLFMSVFCNRKKDNCDVVSVMQLSILLLTLFELVFEARARYLFTYSPIFVIIGMLGTKDFLQKRTKHT